MIFLLSTNFFEAIVRSGVKLETNNTEMFITKYDQDTVQKLRTR